MKKIIATVLLCVPFILLMACKTTVTKDGVTVEKNNSETEGNEAKIRYGTTEPNFIELGFHERLLNATSLDEYEKILQEAKQAGIIVEHKRSEYEAPPCKLICVSPNPTYGAVTVEFGSDMEIKSDEVIVIDLYHNHAKINSLEFRNVKDNKITISSNYLTKEGLYNVVFKNKTTSFYVKKK